jgi:HEAT repeat protein
VSIPLLVESFAKLPQPRQGDDPDLLQAGIQQAMREFRDEVLEKYTEGTLQRLLTAGDEQARRAAALALGFAGTMRSNQALTAALKDEDSTVRLYAAESLREMWLRGDEADHGPRLQQALAVSDHTRAVAALDALIREAPDFAEAYNQRAVLRFRRGEYGLSAADCAATLRLNPAHFGAAAGMGQCYLRMHRPRAALRAFRQALSIHPGLDEVRDAVRELEAALGETE